MPQDAFTIRHVAKELNSLLVGAKISKIIQPARDSLVFIIYTKNGSVKLEACLSAQSSRLSIAAGETNAPQVAPNFCMLLRKHLQNAEITGVFQPDFERIICFNLRCTSTFSVEDMHLYFEIMGKYSNAVLCENGVIVGALKTTSIGENTKRVLFGGVKYSLPQPQDKFAYTETAKIDEALKNYGGDRAKFLCENVAGLSYVTALDMAERYGENISADDVKSYILGDEISPCVIYDGSEPCDFRVRAESGVKRQYPDVLSAQCAYYSYLTKKREFEDKKKRLKSALSAGVKKIDKRLDKLRAKLDECRDTELVKLKGELIAANIYAVKRGDTRLEAVNYYDENSAKIAIELDATLTPAQNMQRYFTRYAKLKRTKTNADGQLAAALKQKDYLLSIGAHISAAESVSDLVETEEELGRLQLLKSAENTYKKRTLPPYRSYVYEGFKILAGRNNLQNERLTKSLSPRDMWLHTQKYHSSHVAVITEGRDVPDGVIKVASEICAYYSDGRDGDKIPVDYTLRKNVKKPPASNAGFVIYTSYETALATPDRHAELAEDSDG